jgi:hypothetical protein
MSLPDKFSLTVEHGKAGLWYITSHDLRGLLVAEETLMDALEAMPAVWEAMEEARAMASPEATPDIAVDGGGQFETDVDLYGKPFK